MSPNEETTLAIQQFNEAIIRSHNSRTLEARDALSVLNATISSTRFYGSESALVTFRLQLLRIADTLSTTNDEAAIKKLIQSILPPGGKLIDDGEIPASPLLKSGGRGRKVEAHNQEAAFRVQEKIRAEGVSYAVARRSVWKSMPAEERLHWNLEVAYFRRAMDRQFNCKPQRPKKRH